jgi:aminoglycoside 6'-N-acetyltransferase I
MEDSRWKIVDLQPDNRVTIEQVARLLAAVFRENWPEAWPDMAAALREVEESFGPERLSRVALDDTGLVLGWIGGIRQYDGHVWELHPLVVRPDVQGQGIGRALVADLEA